MSIFPELRLETPRLLLRPYGPEDAPDVAAACRDELIQQWLPLPDPYTDADALAWCTDLSHRVRTSGDGIQLAAIRRADGRLVASFGLNRTDWRARTTAVGYWVAPWARGQGIATEGTLALARWLLLEQGFERVELRAATGNVASQRVAAKAGFVREGVARNAGFTHAGRVDLVVFSLTPLDLQGPPARPDVRPEDPEAWYRSLPGKRLGGGMLISNAAGDTLLVRPTYEPEWEIPGGAVEENEPPDVAAEREALEELGLSISAGRLLVVDWVPPRPPKTDGLMLIFDGGVLDDRTRTAIRLPADELSEHRFVTMEDLPALLPDNRTRRVAAAIRARAEETTLYLRDGHAT